VAVLEDFETGLSASGYKVIRFSNDDIFLGVVNENLKANIFDLRTLNKVKSSDNNRLIFNLAFLPDNLHLLMFYGDWNGNYELELHDFYGKIRTYYYEGDIIETFGTSDSWKIFYGGGRDTFYLFKNKPTGITDAYNSEIMVSVYVEDTRIYIKTKNVELHNAKIEISDLLGKLLYVENIEILKAYNSVTVKAILPSGIYLCKIITGNREYFQKIEIVR
jgi:hypothetical protein